MLVKDNRKAGKKIGIILGSVVLLVAIFYCGLGYVNDYYKATEKAKMAMIGTQTITVREEEEYFRMDNEKEESDKGIIFYPGGKVEEIAYAPLLMKLAEAGYEVYLVKMPAKLAILGANRGEAIIHQASHIENWTMMGHSLGGAMAASFSGSHDEDIDRLVLLAAYSTEDISDAEIEVFSIYGSEDKVLNMESYKKYWSNLPANAVEEIIEGGNHDHFGHYGQQAGDGEASITRNEQEEYVLDILLNYQ